MNETRNFVGLNGISDKPTVPNAFSEKYEDVEATFAEMYHSLPRAMPTTMGWRNPLTGQFEETDRFQALIDPGKVETYTAYDGDLDEVDDPLYYVPTSDYTAVNPVEFYQPLEEALIEHEATDVFGTAHLDRNGGRCFIDIMFSGEATNIPDEATDSLVTGIHTGYSHLGDVAMFAEGFAQDGSCRNTIRGITKRFSRRHVGNAQEDVQWWETVLESYGAFPDHLAEMIEAALEIELSINDLPFEMWEDFYRLAGFPQYLAQSASSHATSRSGDPWTVNAWNLHSGATYALTHTFSGNLNSQTYQGHMSTANDLLMNPTQVIEGVRARYEQELREMEAESDELESATELFAEVENEIDQYKEEYNTRREKMNELFEEIEAVGQ